MSLLNETKHYIGMDADGKSEVACVNCGCKSRVINEAVKFTDVHAVCPNCHDYVDVDHRGKESIACRHCFAKSYFDNDADKSMCPACGSDYAGKVGERKMGMTVMMFGSNPLSGAITRKYL